MGDLNLSEKEMLKELLAKLDVLLRLKYANNMQKTLDREIDLCKIGLGAFNSINIEELENKYKS